MAGGRRGQAEISLAFCSAYLVQGEAEGGQAFVATVLGGWPSACVMWLRVRGLESASLRSRSTHHESLGQQFTPEGLCFLICNMGIIADLPSTVVAEIK